jgi:hypothetical protein
VPRLSRFKLTMILGFREGHIYRIKGHPMSVMASRSRETYEKEQVASPLVRQETTLVA